MELKDRIRNGWNVSAKGYTNVVKSDLERGPDSPWIKLILERAPRAGRLKILDAGSGPGAFAIALSKAGHDVTGADLSPEMAAEARRNAAEAGSDAKFEVMDLDRPSFPDESFDMIVSRDVVWTLGDPEGAYRSWRRLLVPGGVAVIFDGDWLRDLRDPEHAKLMKARADEYFKRFGEHQTVSYTDYEEARGWRTGLPLAGHPRPEWDVRALEAAGWKDIEHERVNDIVFTDEKRRFINEHTHVFMLTAKAAMQK